MTRAHTTGPPTLRLLRSAAALILIASSAGVRAEDQPRPSPRYLFLDSSVVASESGLCRTVNPPTDRQVVIRPDRPWENQMISFFLTVRQEGGLLRMWYICRDRRNRPNLAYAESRDGLHWTKPNLGIVPYDGSTDNNLVGISSLEGVVFRDPLAPPAERYAYVTHVFPDGIYRFFSPDGLHWRRMAQALLRFNSDTQNVTFWDRRLQRYVLYLRGWNPGTRATRTRKVVRATAASLETPISVGPSKLPDRELFWSKSRLPWIVDQLPTVLACDAEDPAGTDIYNISAQPYPLDPSWYIGFPSFFRHVPGNAYAGRLEVQFVGSRDGIHWNRYDRSAYIAPGLAGSASCNMVFLGTGLVVRGDQIWQYGTGFRSQHGDVAARMRRTDGVIYRYVQRVDGFVSLDSGDAEGRCQTVAVRVSGPRLLLNLDTGALGELRVGLLDPSGRPLPGHGTADCDPLEVNATGACVSWHGRSDLTGLLGRRVILVLRSRRTKLYSFRFG